MKPEQLLPSLLSNDRAPLVIADDCLINWRPRRLFDLVTDLGVSLDRPPALPPLKTVHFVENPLHHFSLLLGDGVAILKIVVIVLSEPFTAGSEGRLGKVGRGSGQCVEDSSLRLWPIDDNLLKVLVQQLALNRPAKGVVRAARRQAQLHQRRLRGHSNDMLLAQSQW
ncbi:hypothetical protein TYRP_009975 [Tyrophagus putrescentiae]|nr:hypothetical protein TYRP_009975 [Tyrophagus putrescentiae]